MQLSDLFETESYSNYKDVTKSPTCGQLVKPESSGQCTDESRTVAHRTVAHQGNEKANSCSPCVNVILCKKKSTK